jgi:hypothetical protein
MEGYKLRNLAKSLAMSHLTVLGVSTKHVNYTAMTDGRSAPPIQPTCLIFPAQPAHP